MQLCRKLIKIFFSPAFTFFVYSVSSSSHWQIPLRHHWCHHPSHEPDGTGQKGCFIIHLKHLILVKYLLNYNFLNENCVFLLYANMTGPEVWNKLKKIKISISAAARRWLSYEGFSQSLDQLISPLYSSIAAAGWGFSTIQPRVYTYDWIVWKSTEF